MTLRSCVLDPAALSLAVDGRVCVARALRLLIGGAAGCGVGLRLALAGAAGLEPAPRGLALLGRLGGEGDRRESEDDRTSRLEPEAGLGDRLGGGQAEAAGYRDVADLVDVGEVDDEEEDEGGDAEPGGGPGPGGLTGGDREDQRGDGEDREDEHREAVAVAGQLVGEGIAAGRSELEGDHELGDAERQGREEDRQRQDQLGLQIPAHALAVPSAPGARRRGRRSLAASSSAPGRGRPPGHAGEAELAGEQGGGADQQQAGRDLRVEAADQRRLDALEGDRRVTGVEAGGTIDDQGDDDGREAGERDQPAGPPAPADRRDAEQQQAGDRDRHEDVGVGVAGRQPPGLRCGGEGLDVGVGAVADRDAPVVGVLGEGEEDRGAGDDDRQRPRRRQQSRAGPGGPVERPQDRADRPGDEPPDGDQDVEDEPDDLEEEREDGAERDEQHAPRLRPVGRTPLLRLDGAALQRRGEARRPGPGPLARRRLLRAAASGGLLLRGVTARSALPARLSLAALRLVAGFVADVMLSLALTPGAVELLPGLRRLLLLGLRRLVLLRILLGLLAGRRLLRRGLGGLVVRTRARRPSPLRLPCPRARRAGGGHRARIRPRRRPASAWRRPAGRSARPPTRTSGPRRRLRSPPARRRRRTAARPRRRPCRRASPAASRPDPACRALRSRSALP